MPLQKLGDFEGAPDGHIEFLLRLLDSKSRQAVIDLITPALAGFPDVTDAAVAAAVDAIAQRLATEDIIVGGDDRVPTRDDPGVHVFESLNGGRPFAIGPNGVWIGSTEIESSADYEIVTANEGLLLGAYAVEGIVRIPILEVKNLTVTGGVSGGGLGGTTGVVKYVKQVDAVATQSKGLGRATPISPGMDPVDDRIYMYQWGTGQLVPATTPLSAPVTATGLSSMMTFAREQIRQSPPGTIIVLMDAGVGDTSIGGDSENGVWKLGYTGSRPDLWTQGMAASQATHNAILAKWGITPEHIMFSDQGEANANTPQATYEADLDALIGDYRTRWGATCAVILNGFVPEWENVSAGRLAIRASRIDTIRRLPYVGFAEMPANSGGALNETDIVHSAREGMLRAGARLQRAYLEALASIPGRHAATPQVVTAQRIDKTVSMQWTQPFSRVLGYQIGYRLGDTGPFTPVPFTTTDPADNSKQRNLVDRKVTFTIPSAAPVQVQVAAFNDVATSAPSTPVYAVGG